MRVEIEVIFFYVLAVIAFVAGQAEEAFFQNRITFVPQSQGKADGLLAVADSGQPIFIPAIGARAGMVVGKILPDVSVRRCNLRGPCPRRARLDKDPSASNASCGLRIRTAESLPVSCTLSAFLLDQSNQTRELVTRKMHFEGCRPRSGRQVEDCFRPIYCFFKFTSRSTRRRFWANSEWFPRRRSRARLAGSFSPSQPERGLPAHSTAIPPRRIPPRSGCRNCAGQPEKRKARGSRDRRFA